VADFIRLADCWPAKPYPASLINQFNPHTDEANPAFLARAI
jgi:hypothetical protein